MIRRWPRGAYLMPAVFDGVGNDMRIAKEEIFGPVVSIIPFDTEAEAIRLANATPYGLSGSVWSRDIGKALRTAKGIQAGVLSVNSQQLGPHRGAVRRLQDVRHRARAGHVGDRHVHRDQEHLHRPSMTGSGDRQGREPDERVVRGDAGRRTARLAAALHPRVRPVRRGVVAVGVGGRSAPEPTLPPVAVDSPAVTVAPSSAPCDRLGRPPRTPAVGSRTFTSGLDRSSSRRRRCPTVFVHGDVFVPG